jgi:hypothetical protein
MGSKINFYYQMAKQILVLLILVISLGASAKNTKRYSGGLGTQSRPYVIKSFDDIVQLSQSPDDWTAFFIQKADVIAPNSSSILKSIGRDAKNPFTGSYDGGNYIIKGLTIDREKDNYGGLFNRVQNATLKNIKLKNLVLKNYNNAGFLVGNSENSTISNCSVNALVPIVSGDFGGLIRICRNSKISGCRAEITLKLISEGKNVGGLIACVRDYSEIVNCSASFIIEDKDVKGDDFIGGLIGSSYESDIHNCIAEGSIRGNSCVGGLVGTNKCKEFGEIKNCFSAVDIAGNCEIGGLVGDNEGSIYKCKSIGLVTGVSIVVDDAKGGSSNVGGLIGYHRNGLVKYCCALGAVTGRKDIGGLIGDLSKGDVSNCFATGYVLGEESVGGLIGSSHSFNQIYHSMASGRVVGVENVGGFIGYIFEGGYIKQCCSEGKLVGQRSVGGFIGETRMEVTFNDCYSTRDVTGLFDGDMIKDIDPNYIGGFGGSLGDAILYKCYAQTNIVGKTNLGIFAGDLSSCKALNCFASGKVLGFDYSGEFSSDNSRAQLYNYYPTKIVERNGNRYRTQTSQSVTLVPAPTAVNYFTNAAFSPFNFQKEANSDWWFNSEGKSALQSELVIVYNESLSKEPVIKGNISVKNNSITIVESGYRYLLCGSNKWLSRSFDSDKHAFSIDFPLSIEREDYFIQSYAIDSQGKRYYGNMLCTKYCDK